MARKQDNRKQVGGESTLTKYRDLLVVVQRAYASGATELPADVKSKWDFAMRDDGATLMGFVIYPIAAGKMEPRLAELTLGADGRYAALASDWAAVTKFTGHVPGGFTRFDAEESLRALSAKRGIPKGDDWLAMCEAVESQKGLGSMLRHWTERTGPFTERTHSREDRMAGVAEAISEMQGGKPANRKAELEAKLADARARKAQALKDEDADTLKQTKAEIIEIEAEIAKLTEMPMPADRKAELEAKLADARARKAQALKDEDADTLKQTKAEIIEIEAEIAKLTETPMPAAETSEMDTVIAFCTSPKAGKGAKLLYARWEKDALTDEQFTANVKALMA